MRRSATNHVRWGALALLIVAIGTFLGFTKDVPFTRPFQVKAVFESSNSIRPGSPVRIAGVGVGKVAAVRPLGDSAATEVLLSIDKKGLPVHDDATAKIRPRIFLEGNFFVDLTPGTPGSPKLEDGDTIKVTNTSKPVQLDEVLTALQDPTRQDLRTILRELGTGLEDGAPSFNRAYADIAPSERDTSIVNAAFLGSQPDKDLQRLIRGLSKATAGLARNEMQLQDFVTDLSTTLGAFAQQRDNLRSAIRELGPTLDTTNRSLASINAALPPTRGFARAILPGVRETDATIQAGFPWIRQARQLVSQPELRGLAQDLSPTGRDTARFVDSSLKLFPQGNLLAKCVTRTLVPGGDLVVRDRFGNGQPNYRELAYALVGLNGEGQNRDGNGVYVHFQPGGGGESVALDPKGLQPFFVQAFPGTRVQPEPPSRKPPFNASVPCFKSKLPDLNGPAASVGAFGSPASEVIASQQSPTTRREAAPALRSEMP